MIDLVANIMAILTNTKLMITLIKKGLAFYIKVLSVNARTINILPYLWFIFL